jgi:glutaredoxin 3
MHMVEGFRVYTQDKCKFCDKAKNLLESYGQAYAEFDCADPENRKFLRLNVTLEPGKKLTVPQIWHGDRHVGGCSDLEKYLKEMANE